MKTDWENLYKVKLASSIPEMDLHDVVKLLLVRKILRKNKRKHFLRIYTEFELEEVGLKPDVYMENIKDKSVIIYEIQKNYTKEWLKEKTKQYKNYEVYNFTVDFIPIDLNDCPENVEEITKWLEQYVF